MATRGRAPDYGAIDAVLMVLACLPEASVVSVKSVIGQVRLAAPRSLHTDEQLSEIITLAATNRQMAVALDLRRD